MSNKGDQTAQWRNRIVGHGEEAPDQLLANPRNWRIHPKAQQEAMTGVLSDIGWIDEVIVNRRTNFVVNGHLRVAIAISEGQKSVPVRYVDLDEAEEAEALATFDPLGAMAATDKELLDGLLRDVATGEAGVQQMLEDLAAKAGIIPPQTPEELWKGMPEFEQEDKLGDSAHRLIVHFKTLDAKAEFGELIGQTLTEATKYVWYPEQKPEDRQSYRWVDES